MNESQQSNGRVLKYVRILQYRWRLILITFSVVMVTSGVIVSFLPRQYFSKVTLEVSRLLPNYRGEITSAHLEILESTEILYPVIDTLDLVKEFSPPRRRLTQQH